MLQIELEELLNDFGNLLSKITSSREAVKVKVDGEHDFVLMNSVAYEEDLRFLKEKEKALIEEIDKLKTGRKSL